MFTIINTNSDGSGANLAFLPSKDVQVFPCGRRRSPEITNGNGTYQIPFDPEARLNTEANNRKHSSLNGFTQTYLDWTNDTLSMALDGYLFYISSKSPEKFGESFSKEIKGNPSSVYANIIIEDSKLYSGDSINYSTGVLSSQSNSNNQSSLDILISGATATAVDSYYFSGLSFSAAPQSGWTANSEANSAAGVEGDATRSKKIIKAYVDTSNDTSYPKQIIVSLKILENVDGTWKIYQPALLPKIEHGDDENSVKIDNLETSSLNVSTDLIVGRNANISGALSAAELTQNGKKVPTINVVVDQNDGTWQLQISGIGNSNN